MLKKQKLLRFLVAIICALAAVVGASGPTEQLSQMNASDCLIWIPIVFLFFSVNCILFALSEKIFFGAISTVLGAANRNAIYRTQGMSSGWGFFTFGGFFLISGGCGLAVSFLWSDSLRILQGCVLASGGTGLLVGAWLAKRITGKHPQTRKYP